MADIMREKSMCCMQKRASKPKAENRQPVGPAATTAKKKPSYMEAREYETIEQRVAEADQVLEAKRQALEDPEVMKDGRLLEQTYREMEAAQDALDALYARWAELEAKIN